MYMFIYVYTYTYMHTCTYILHIYVYDWVTCCIAEIDRTFKSTVTEKNKNHKKKNGAMGLVCLMKWVVLLRAPVTLAVL